MVFVAMQQWRWCTAQLKETNPVSRVCLLGSIHLLAGWCISRHLAGHIRILSRGSTCLCNACHQVVLLIVPEQAACKDWAFTSCPHLSQCCPAALEPQWALPRPHGWGPAGTMGLRRLFAQIEVTQRNVTASIQQQPEASAYCLVGQQPNRGHHHSRPMKDGEAQANSFQQVPVRQHHNKI